MQPPIALHGGRAVSTGPHYRDAVYCPFFVVLGVGLQRFNNRALLRVCYLTFP